MSTLTVLFLDNSKKVIASVHKPQNNLSPAENAYDAYREVAYSLKRSDKNCETVQIHGAKISYFHMATLQAERNEFYELAFRENISECVAK